MKRLLALFLLSLLTFGAQAFWGAADTKTGEISAAQLPPEARQVLIRIRQGGPFPYMRDGIVFGNREGRLPPKAHGYYREYTVPTPGAGNRGARRIIAGRDGDDWYTVDHYRSFKRIRE